MGTSCLIGIAEKGNKVSYISCHWDGYIEYVGRILVEHYQDVEKIKKLISLGNLSSLGERVDPIGEHSFEKQEDGTCVFYGRDRGETEQDPTECYEFEYIGEAYSHYVDYVYLYNGERWYYQKLIKNFMTELEGDL